MSMINAMYAEVFDEWIKISHAISKSGDIRLTGGTVFTADRKISGQLQINKSDSW